MAARQRRPAQLGLDPASYNPVGLRAYSTEELKHEYASLRREATERVRSLGRSKLWSQTEAYRSNVGQYPTLKEIGDDRRALERKIIQAQRFVTAKRSSPSGQRDILRKKLESLHRSPGYDWVTMDNALDFFDFMGWLDARSEKQMFYKLIKAYDEEDEESLAEAGEEMQQAFEDWLEGNSDELKPMQTDEDDADEQDTDQPQPQPQPARKPSKAGRYPAKKKAGRRQKRKNKKQQKRKKGRR